jgi:hypothetical protein
MNKILTSLATMLVATSACGQSTDQLPSSPMQVVQELLSAYNNDDLDRIEALHDTSASIYILPSTQPLYVGRPQIRNAYADQVENNCLGTMGRTCPDLFGTITSWQAVGRWVTTVERVTLDRNDPPLTYIIVYEVRNGLIQNAWFMPGGGP